uniref:Uncharacterized protein n=1 Tax=Rhizophora mucronata TaxID=61149 RepID=A0A2P2LNV4_RHIMU
MSIESLNGRKLFILFIDNLLPFLTKDLVTGRFTRKSSSMSHPFPFLEFLE